MEASGETDEERSARLKTQRQHLDCMRSVDEVLNSNRYVRHMLSLMNQRGCGVSRSFFTCEACPEELLIGGFWDSARGVVLCQNRPRSTAQIGRTMLHELIHAYDWCRVDFSPQSCLHLACTEIRAANLSGDCNLSMEIIRGRSSVLAFTKHKQQCVKRLAAVSVAMNPHCQAQAQRSVELAWDLCFPDTTPFDHVP